MSAVQAPFSAVAYTRNSFKRQTIHGEVRGRTYLVQKILTIAALLVMNEAKLVGTKPGAIQFTRVLGAISAARAYTSYYPNYQILENK